MFPTLLDFEIQKQINQEHIMKAALRRQLKANTSGGAHGFKSGIVRFGAWLERLGCRLQERFAPPCNLEFGGAPFQDATPQSC
jgi:hypothetical protein